MERKQGFTVTNTAGVYATETLELRSGPAMPLDLFRNLSAMIEGLPAGAQVELDLLRVGSDLQKPATADWVTNVAQATANGLYVPLLGPWRGARMRVKSGGTAGTPTVCANYDTVDWD